MVSWAPQTPESVKKTLENFAESIDSGLKGGLKSEASIVSVETTFSRRALSHHSDRTSTTENSLHLQGRTLEGDLDELSPFINEEKFQAERIVEKRGQRERDRRLFLQEDRGIRGICYRFTQNAGVKALSNIMAFLTFVLVIVLANAAAEKLRFPEDSQKDASFRQLEVLMTVLISLYIVEVIISFIGCPVSPRIYDGWLVLDCVVASIAFLDEFVLLHFNSAGIMRTTRAVRLLRILRVGRVFRILSMVRSFPLLALVLIETTIRLLWMFAIWSVIGWCTAAIITVVIGGVGYEDLPDIQDPLVQAIIDAGPKYPLEPEVILRGLGGTLLLMNLMPMRLIYWGPSVWKLLTLQNPRLNIAGVCLVVYTALCVIWIWPMVVGSFISVLRDGQERIQKTKAKKHRAKQEFSVEDLSQIFEDVVGDSTERFISLEDFREMQRMHPNFAKLLGNEGKSFQRTDAIFRSFDIMSLSFLTLPDFVLGVLKLLRVLPRPEFSTMDEQQRRALKIFSKAAGGNRFSFLVTNRYLHEFRSELSKFVAASSHVIATEVRPQESMGLHAQLPAVNEQEEKQVKAGFMARLQEKYDFRQRLVHAEEALQYFSQRQQQDVIKESFKKVAEEILHEDIMPMLQEQMPMYLELQKQSQKASKQRAAERDRRRSEERETLQAVAAPMEGAAPSEVTTRSSFRLSSLPASNIFYSTT